MEPTLRSSASVSSRISAIDVGQLDKINAIPNKTTNNVLLDGLSAEDKLYLDTLMDESSSESENNDDLPNGSPWSTPMAERPMRMGGNKRVKRMKMKPSYAITLSLEDISYIRPSWGMSKGQIKRVEANKSKVRKVHKMDLEKKDKPIKIDEHDDGDEKKPAAKLGVNFYHLFLVIVMLILAILMLLSYLVDLSRHRERTREFRIELHPNERAFDIFKQRELSSSPASAARKLRVNYGRGIPGNLKHDECTCNMHDKQTQRRDSGGEQQRQSNCFGCFDWALRANMELIVNKTQHVDEHPASLLLDDQDDLSITCYNIRWQSYDTLETPLVDCLQVGESDQWFGLGDIQTPVWPLNKLEQFDFAALSSNLSAEFFDDFEHKPGIRQEQAQASLSLGSHVDLTLISSSGFLLGNLESDFQPSVRISASRREICLSVACLDKCTQLWSRPSETALRRLRRENNVLKYSICSANDWRLLGTRLIDERVKRLADKFSAAITTPAQQSNETAPTASTAAPSHAELKSNRSLETEATAAGPRGSEAPASDSSGPAARELKSQPSQTWSTSRRSEGIGLIERTIFRTSQEYIPNLDGQTLRQHVDKIVKLNLKTSPILLLDTRWQTYAGSFKLNAALFPKAKLLFEILHNKGFKIVMTVKPYIDVNIGIGAINQLMEFKRLVAANYEGDFQLAANPLAPRVRPAGAGSQQTDAANENSTATVERRKSLFLSKNETIFFKDSLEQRRASSKRKPHLFECRESYHAHCVLIDILTPQNRAWMIELIKRSSFLSQEADAVLIGGAHPESLEWDARYRLAMHQLIDDLFYCENLYALPQWSGNFNYIELAPRRRTWDGLRSIVDSVLSLGMQGHSLIHPGSVWADIKARASANEPSAGDQSGAKPSSLSSRRNSGPAFAGGKSGADSSGLASEQQSDEELAVRWLQVAVFLPILQFNDLTPIDRFDLHEQVRNLVRIRKLYVVPEIKRNLPYTPLIHQNGLDEYLAARASANQQQQRHRLAALRYTWTSPLSDSGSSEAVGQQFMIGADMLVAPILSEGQRQKDIYLPVGMWHDELRQTNIRGGKWLRNYPLELNEIAWFTRARR